MFLLKDKSNKIIRTEQILFIYYGYSVCSYLYLFFTGYPQGNYKILMYT